MEDDLNELDTSLEEDLDELDTSMSFSIVLIIAALFSLFATNLDRKQLVAQIREEEVPEFPTSKIRIFTNVLVLICLVYFFSLSREGLQEASNPLDRFSAKINYTASILVLLASSIRFFDIFVLDKLDESEFEELETAELPLI